MPTRKYVSASDIGRAKFCERAFALQESGHTPSGKRLKSRLAGTAYHDAVNQTVTRSQGVKSSIIVRLMMWFVNRLKAIINLGRK